MRDLLNGIEKVDRIMYRRVATPYTLVYLGCIAAVLYVSHVMNLKMPF